MLPFSQQVKWVLLQFWDLHFEDKKHPFCLLNHSLAAWLAQYSFQEKPVKGKHCSPPPIPRGTGGGGGHCAALGVIWDQPVAHSDKSTKDIKRQNSDYLLEPGREYQLYL